MILSFELSNWDWGWWPRLNGEHTSTDCGYPLLRTSFRWKRLDISFERNIEETDEGLEELWAKYNWSWSLKKPLKIERRFRKNDEE